MSDRVALSLIGVVSLLAVSIVASLLLGRAPGGSGLDVTALPTVNAVLNGSSAVLLTTGFLFIRRRKVAAHRACMLGAFAVSVLFLVGYLVYHYHTGSRAFTGRGSIRPIYFVLLVSHIVLAATIIPLALTTINRGLSAQFPRHARVARWTLPIWLYVSVTGVLVYLLLYHW